MDPESQELFTIVLPSGLYTPTRVPQGMLNATAFFQSTMANILSGLLDRTRMVWIDDLVVWGSTPGELVDHLDDVLQRLQERGLYVAAHKCTFYEPCIKWCGKIYSGQDVEHDP